MKGLWLFALFFGCVAVPNFETFRSTDTETENDTETDIDRDGDTGVVDDSGSDGTGPLILASPVRVAFWWPFETTAISNQGNAQFEVANSAIQKSDAPQGTAVLSLDRQEAAMIAESSLVQYSENGPDLIVGGWFREKNPPTISVYSSWYLSGDGAGRLFETLIVSGVSVRMEQLIRWS